MGQRACERTEGAEPHLQFPPQAALAATYTVHNPGDVFEVEPKLLLQVTETPWCHHPLCPLTFLHPHQLTPPTARSCFFVLTFSVAASSLCPANMDFSSKCIGNSLRWNKVRVYRG